MSRRRILGRGIIGTDNKVKISKWDLKTRLTDAQSKAIEDINILTAGNIHQQCNEIKLSENKNKNDNPLFGILLQPHLHTSTGSSPPKTVSTKAWEYYRYVKDCKDRLSQTKDDLKSLVDIIHDIEGKYCAVSTSTAEVSVRCQELLQRQGELDHSAKRIEQSLFYFDEAQNISKQLRTVLGSLDASILPPLPSEQTVSAQNNNIFDEMKVDLAPQQSDFSLEYNKRVKELLDRLDSAIEFMAVNAEFKDAKQYRIFFYRLQAKLLRSIKDNFKTTLNNTQQTLQIILSPSSSEKNQQSVSTTNPGANLTSTTDGLQSTSSTLKAFVELRSVAAGVSPLLKNIEARCKGVTNIAYRDMIRECCDAYYESRYNSLQEDINIYVQSFLPATPLPNLARTAMMHLIEVGSLEYQLFHEFFDPNSYINKAAEELLDSVCMVVYTALRPLIIRQMDIDILCEVITLLKYEILDQQIKPRGDCVSSIKTLIARLVQDLQERLTYRSQVFVRDQIMIHTSMEGDLDYPAKLIAKSNRKKNEKNNNVKNSEEKFATMVDSSENQAGEDKNSRIFSDWHPVLERSLLFLSKLYRCVDVDVFKYLAYYALEHTFHTLATAATQIQKREEQKNSLSCDGCLFLIKHLLILKEQLSPYQVDFAITELSLDFTQANHYVPSFLRRDSQMWTNFILSAVTTTPPSLQEAQLDTKKTLEMELKKACEALIERQTHQLLGTITSFLDKATSQLNLNNDDKKNQQKYEKLQAKYKEELLNILLIWSEDLKEVGSIIEDSNKKQYSLKYIIHIVKSSTSLYLDSPVTEKILFKPIKADIIQVVSKLRFFIDQNYPHTSGSNDQLYACLKRIEQIINELQEHGT